MAAWTAEIDGRPVGQVCRIGPIGGFADATEMNRACTEALGCEVEQLAWVVQLFVGRGARRKGLGRRLLDMVLDDVRRAGLYPGLGVLPEAALGLYRGTGWREVLRVRPEWLSGTAAPAVLAMVLPGEDTPAG